MNTADYVVRIDDHDLEGQPCECGNCGWRGVADGLETIENCSLTPGDPSPAGRCPECGALAYLARPIDYARNAGPDLVRALEKAEQRIKQLCGTVNAQAAKLDLGQKVYTGDFLRGVSEPLAKAKRGGNG